MNQPSGRFPPNVSELHKLVEGTEHAETLGAESKLERIILDAMKASDDPITREIGEGLAGGTMTWQTIATTSAYADFLDHGLTALRQFDFKEVIEYLKTADTARPGEDRRGDDEDDGADLWQGLSGKRR